MTVVELNIPSEVANRFSGRKISYQTLIEDYEEHGWHDYTVNMDIDSFREILKEECDHDPFSGLESKDGQPHSLIHHKKEDTDDRIMA